MPLTTGQRLGPYEVVAAIGADGRFLMMKNSGTDAASQSIVVVSHWLNELRARMGGK